MTADNKPQAEARSMSSRLVATAAHLAAPARSPRPHLTFLFHLVLLLALAQTSPANSCDSRHCDHPEPDRVGEPGNVRTVSAPALTGTSEPNDESLVLEAHLSSLPSRVLRRVKRLKTQVPKLAAFPKPAKSKEPEPSQDDQEEEADDEPNDGVKAKESAKVVAEKTNNKHTNSSKGQSIKSAKAVSSAAKQEKTTTRVGAKGAKNEKVSSGRLKDESTRLTPKVIGEQKETTNDNNHNHNNNNHNNHSEEDDDDDDDDDSDDDSDDEHQNAKASRNAKLKGRVGNQDELDRDEKKVPKKGSNKSLNNTTASGAGSISRSRTSKPLVNIPFLAKKNASTCAPQAYLEFPPDLIGNKWRSRGLVIIHIAVVCYMFYGLALVCERYFMPSLEEFAQRLQISEDVAGATLMSAGSSAPELFTAILGVFVAKNDVGTGALVGSAVFNILFVIGLCAFVSTTTAQLNWWPVLRDSFYYTFTVLVLILFIYDERITMLESATMIALYGVYILIMVHNDKLKEQVTRLLQSHPVTCKLVSSAISLDGPDDVFTSTSVYGSSSTSQMVKGGRQQTTSLVERSSSVEDDAMFLAAMLVIIKHKRLFSGFRRFQSAARYIMTKRQNKLKQQLRLKELQSAAGKESNEVNYFGPENEPLKSAGNQKERIAAYASNASLSKNKFSIVSRDDYEFWNRPPEEGENYYIWLAKIPVNYVLHYTVPDCALYPDKYLFTFFISIIWTAFFSYIMVWMVTLIGYTLGIPDSVMGVTFLAAGTSVPDCYSSIHAARNGMADMAVSNSIGSNVFDILIGLSLPWFVQSLLGQTASINSRGVIYSVILLFLSLIVTIYLMNKYEWTLKPRLGLALLIAYGLFIVLTCMLEFNLFGHVNPLPCTV